MGDHPSAQHSQDDPGEPGDVGAAGDVGDAGDADCLVDGYLVRRYRIIGTRSIVYDAWEPAQPADGHSMLTGHGGQWWGQIGSGPLPAEVDALPAWSDARSRAFRAWQRREHARAYTLILRVFPDAAHGRRHDGEITRIVPARSTTGKELLP